MIEFDVAQIITIVLKYAPDRRGGGGRRRDAEKILGIIVGSLESVGVRCYKRNCSVHGE